VIPVRYRNAEVEGKDLQAWLAHVLDGGAQGLGLAGPTGTGKSYALWALYRVLIDAEVNAIAINLIEYLDGLRPGSPEQTLTIEKLVRTPVLMLDDLGVHKSSDWTDERVYRILNSRYENVRPTVFTTNSPVDEWEQVLGERVAWRLIEDCRVVEMRGKNRRRR
jgi:DNA replication protein DnaC